MKIDIALLTFALLVGLSEFEDESFIRTLEEKQRVLIMSDYNNGSFQRKIASDLNKDSIFRMPSNDKNIVNSENRLKPDVFEINKWGDNNGN